MKIFDFSCLPQKARGLNVPPIAVASGEQKQKDEAFDFSCPSKETRGLRVPRIAGPKLP